VGEICTRGRNVFVGYLWDEEKTREVVDAEGWVHSGDLGWQDQDGFFYVSGRMKEILITGGGENVAPVPIEEGIKAELGEVVSQAMVVGDRRKHLAVLLTLRTELDPRGQPTLALHPEGLAWLRARGSQSTSTLEVLPRCYKPFTLPIPRAAHRGG
jgi:long-chain-fatty-acid--CoA ligase ACSBG